MGGRHTVEPSLPMGFNIQVSLPYLCCLGIHCLLLLSQNADSNDLRSFQVFLRGSDEGKTG